MSPSFRTLTGADVRVKVVEVGSSLTENDPPLFSPMVKRGDAALVGFEPDPAGLADLNAKKGPNEQYLPHAVGDGGRHTLHVCYSAGMTSLLSPDPAVLSLFHGFSEWGQVTSTLEVDTVRLDDVPETAGADLIQLDIQGAELMALQNAKARLSDALVIHCEVEFLPLYRNQPLFSDVETYLRGRGFLFHRFMPLVSRIIRPLLVGGDIYGGLSQAVWADGVFVRDYTRLGALSDRQLLAMGMILHDCYRSADLVLHLLNEYDRRTGERLSDAYLEGLQGSRAAA